MTVSYKPDMSNSFIVLDQNKHCIKVTGHINKKKKNNLLPLYKMEFAHIEHKLFKGKQT